MLSNSYAKFKQFLFAITFVLNHYFIIYYYYHYLAYYIVKPYYLSQTPALFIGFYVVAYVVLCCPACFLVGDGC